MAFMLLGQLPRFWTEFAPELPEQVKLPFADAMYELDATNCGYSRSEAFQAQHGT